MPEESVTTDGESFLRQRYDSFKINPDVPRMPGQAALIDAFRRGCVGIAMIEAGFFGKNLYLNNNLMWQSVVSTMHAFNEWIANSSGRGFEDSAPATRPMFTTPLPDCNAT